MGDGRQLRAAPEPDVDVILRDGSQLTLPTSDEPLPARDDEFPAIATAAAIAATLVAAPFIFPTAATGAAAAAAAVGAAAAAAAATIAGVTLNVGFVHGDAAASSRATLLSPSAQRRHPHW